MKYLKGVLPGGVLALVLVFAASLPAQAASPLKINVNGDQMPFGAMYQENGVSMISAADFAQFSGAALSEGQDDSCTLTENGNCLVFFPGTQDAILNGKTVILPAAPVQSGNGLMVPLRFTALTFGYQVGWDGADQTASLTRQEIKDGMTPVQLLAKAALAAQAVNTYSMTGNLQVSTDISVDGKPAAPVCINEQMTGNISTNPLEMYMKEVLTPAGGQTGTTVEDYMTADKMYINTGGQGWMIFPTVISPDFIKQQESIQSDPLKVAAQMENMGVLLSYGDNVTIDGNEYYVVNGTIDPQKFIQGYQQLMQQFIPPAALSGGAGSANFQEVMTKLLQNSKIDFTYTMYINKQTLLTEMTKLNGYMQFNINTADFPAPAGAPAGTAAKTPQHIQISITLQGNVKTTDFGCAFTPPDVSGAKPYSPGVPGAAGGGGSSASQTPGSAQK